jgi:hypothetical protein
MPTLNIEVTELLDNLNLPLRNAIQLLRSIITDANIEVKENIKWS